MGEIIDGKTLAKSLRSELKSEVEKLAKSGLTPKLTVILVGEDSASQVYVRNKERAAKKVGIAGGLMRLPAETSEEKLLKIIDELNKDETNHGILVQLPLPKHIDEQKVLTTIDPKKDVDGFHISNIGRLVTGQPCLKPCTPSGIINMIEKTGVDISGKSAVIIGRSNIVGKPVALMLLSKHATVTICHSRTKNLAEVAKSADILVAAIGKPEFVKGDWIKPGAIVIDVGINRIDDGRLVGDVEFASAKERASFITPVPGGVGPMTIAMLLKNTVEAAKALK